MIIKSNALSKQTFKQRPDAKNWFTDSIIMNDIEISEGVVGKYLVLPYYIKN